MIEQFQSILRALYGPPEGKKPITGIDIGEQFHSEEVDPEVRLRQLNAAFLISLCGPSHPLYDHAVSSLSRRGISDSCRTAVDFYQRGRNLVTREFLRQCSIDRSFAEKVSDLRTWFREASDSRQELKAVDKVWRVFFPEGVNLLEDKEFHINALRKKRVVRIKKLNPNALNDPVKQVVFTSNVLLTIPPDNVDLHDMTFSRAVRNGVEKARSEQQEFWYDHPVQIGADHERNEILYGLTALDEAVRFEKERGSVDRNDRLCCVLSISVTHPTLRPIAKQYLKEMLGKAEKLKHLLIYAFTESDTARLVNDVLVPAAERYLQVGDSQAFCDIIGVDGEYGRHYSFLKAISAFWHVFVDPGVRGTFKIDLDQVFPQEELVRQTGFSALEHFRTPLWGAEGVDSRGVEVALGMIAGTLVNQTDARISLFTPDVAFPGSEIHGDEWIFFSRLPQALSTRAEMMTRYGMHSSEDQKSVIQRVHVTGGTTGILVDHLRKYRPFTPTFVGRAEDQAYLLSVLCRDSGKGLRSLHKDGLVMRHDKEAFAGEAIQAASTGKLLGDYLRILVFSYYARALPGGASSLKEHVDPYTGCFISRIPLTVMYLRFALKAASYFKAGLTSEAIGLAGMGVNRIGRVVRQLEQSANPFEKRYEKERLTWDLYYDLLDRVEESLKEKDPHALEFKMRAVRLLKECRVAG